MQPVVIERKTILFTMNLGTAIAGSFETELDFNNPDVMIVRQFVYSTNDAASNDFYTLNTNVVNDQTITMFGNQSCNLPLELTFYLKKPVPLLDLRVQGSGVPTGQLGILIEFQKWEK
jgi:hypothetical protein